MITVEKRSYLDALPNKIINEYALVKDEGRMYQFIDNEWKPMKIEGEGLQISLYDINQNIFSQLNPMTDEQLQYAHAEIYKFLGETMTSENNYWALICWERHYITIFHNNPDSDEELSDIIMEILESLGDIKDITNRQDGAMEIWITDSSRERPETNYYLLFNYNEGTVEGVA